MTSNNEFRSLVGISSLWDAMNISYYSLQKGHCLICKNHMATHELFPPNRKPNAICPICYRNLIRELTKECLVCGEYLEEWQLDNQMVDPIDISFRVHQHCLYYFEICSRKVLGDDMSDVQDEDYFMNQVFGNATELGHNQVSDQVPNQVHIGSKNSHSLRLGSGQPALPPPVQRTHVPKKVMDGGNGK